MSLSTNAAGETLEATRSYMEPVAVHGCVGGGDISKSNHLAALIDVESSNVSDAVLPGIRPVSRTVSLSYFRSVCGEYS